MSIKKRKYDESYLQYGLTSIVANNEERPQCVLRKKVLINDSMRPAKLKQHLQNVHPHNKDKEKTYFERQSRALKKMRLDASGEFFTGECKIVQGGPKVGIQLLNYFLCALKLPAVHFMWPKSRHTVNGENYLEILCEVVVPQLQTKPNFDELFFQQDGTSPHYPLRVRDYLNKVFTQRWFGRTGSIEWPPCSPDLTPMDFFFWGVVKNKEYVKNKEKNPKTVNELKDCIYDAFREIDAN